MTLAGVLDPNWKTDQGGGGKGADSHYELAGVEEMAWAYRQSPPWNDHGTGLLFMWATTLSLCTDGWAAPHQLARALGFRICASWVWWKCDDLTSDVEDIIGDALVGEGSGRHYDRPLNAINSLHGIFAHAARPNIGFYESCDHEFLFLCRRGDFDIEQYDAIKKVRDRSVICAPRVVDENGAIIHSAKPPKAFTQTIEPILGAALPGVRPIEWNCRSRRKGFSAYGRLHGELLADGVTPAPLVYEIGED